MECEQCGGEGFKEYDAGLLVIGCKACSGIGKVDEALTKEEFERAYAFRSDMTPDQVTELGLIAMPSDCIEGWAMEKAVMVSPGAATDEAGEEPDKVNPRLVNLCDTCSLEQPICMAEGVEFGDGVGNDNVISCDTYDPVKPTHLIIKPELEEVAKELIRAIRELKPNEYQCSKCSKEGKPIIHMLQKSGKGIGHKHLEFKIDRLS